MTAEEQCRPVWWTRQYVDSYVLSEEEAWQIIQSPPWKCVVAWVTRDCQPVVCEMAYVILDDKIMLTSTENRDKVKAFRRNPAIALCFQGRGMKQVTVRGRVELSNDPALVRRWAETTVDAGGLNLSGPGREQEIQRYLSPDRLVLIVHVDKIRTFDGARMFREEQQSAAGS
jgi:hypothetical protein